MARVKSAGVPVITLIYLRQAAGQLEREQPMDHLLGRTVQVVMGWKHGLGDSHLRYGTEAPPVLKKRLTNPD